MNFVPHGAAPAVSLPAVLDFLHNGVFIAIIANGLIGISLVWDKVLLRKPETRNLVSYVFWLGAISIFGLLLVPFGFHWPRPTISILALVTGMLHLAAVWFYYAALKRGEASQTLAVMGGFSPVATALIALPLLRQPYLARGNLLAFALLVGGGFVMFLSEKLNLRRILPDILLASGLFGLVNVLQKVVFDNANFVSGYVIFTLGTFAGAMLLLVRRRWRRQIFVDSEKAEPRSRFWYFVNRFVSGVGSFLIFYAIDLAHPAVVDAISGVRYAIIFLGAYGLTRLYPRWLQENFRGWTLAGKSLATLLIVAGLVFLGLSGRGQNAGPAARLRAPAFRRLSEGNPAGGSGNFETRNFETALYRDQHHPYGHQRRPRPTFPPHLFPEQILRQRRFQQVTGGGGGNGKAQLGDGEQVHEGKE